MRVCGERRLGGSNLEADAMKLSIIVAVATLALAGQASAQSSTSHGGGVSVPYPVGIPDYYAPPPSRSPAQAAAAEAVYRQMHFACIPDQKVFCADKTGHAIGQCLRDHVRKVTPPCKQAMAKARLADEGKL
jgi:hypothetical protein